MLGDQSRQGVGHRILCCIPKKEIHRFASVSDYPKSFSTFAFTPSFISRLR
jgi:hypothetical protein